MVPSTDHTQGDSALLLLDAGRRGAQEKPEPLALQGLLQGFGDIGVLVGEDLLLALDDGHAAAEPAEHLSELHADVAAAEDEQVLRHLGQSHDAGVVQEVDAAQAFQGRNIRPRARVNKDALALEHLLADADLVRADEAGMPAVEVQGLPLLDLPIQPGAPTGPRPDPCGRPPWAGPR